MNPILKEALKEGARVLVSSLLTIVITSCAIIAAGINLEKGTVNINWVLLYLSALLQAVNAIGTAVTKASDKYAHLTNKEGGYQPVDGKAPSMGIIPF